MGDRQVKVSVLVPIYKVEKYLHRCLDSVISQNFQDYELVLEMMVVLTIVLPFAISIRVGIQI